MGILLYHKVDEKLKSVWYVSPDTFKSQMLSLKNKKIVYLDDYNPKDPNHIVITFDGVYKNILKYAAPILKELNYPFELFITGDYVGKDNSFDTPEPLEYFANEDELKEFVKMGGRLQWHTNTHRKFDENMSLSDVEKEMQIPENLKLLDTKGFTWFAYPHGDLTQDKVNIVKKYFKGALSCYQGNNYDLYMLDRIMVFENTILKENKTKKFIQNIFSIKNGYENNIKYKILGIKFNFRNQNLAQTGMAVERE